MILELSGGRSDRVVNPLRGERVSIEHRHRDLSALGATWAGHPWTFEHHGHVFSWRSLLPTLALLHLLHQRTSWASDQTACLKSTVSSKLSAPSCPCGS